MHSLDGMTKTPGSGDNPRILAIRDAIAENQRAVQLECECFDRVLDLG